MAQHPIIDFDWLEALHDKHHLRLATREDPPGFVHLDENPAAFTAELIRLAAIGQKVEQAGAKMDIVTSFFPVEGIDR